jgi:hypothetical protein
MTEALNLVYQTIDDQHAEKSAHTRRQLVAGAAATLGGMGLLGAAPEIADARHSEDPQTILNVAATAERIATIINTVGANILTSSDVNIVQARTNVRAAARHEAIHEQVLTSPGIDGRPAADVYWIPDAVFASPTALLSTLEVGDQIFINAYLIATTVFGNRGNGQLARIASEFMGVEMVHRALARQSLGKLGNDRVFAKYSQAEGAPDAPNAGTPGFRRVTQAVTQLQAAGIGIGAQGATPGRFYNYDPISESAPNTRVTGVNTIFPR